MHKLTRILLFAVLATLGLAACSPASDGPANNPAAPGLPEGRPTFLISYADW